ncbi:hypothetical protein [Thermotoga sp. KOL6]|uniref:hypothetical protein n=1 Tax=Thermotoga sp. KOL6 TaxID=126741 RepID=UPI000C7846DC|nr:hypothetical protein [Thermotoga sp. KOL6]PLV60402.1 hypothetical protein AS005_03765 [Thermotoga sp. KOL6]
MKRWMFFVYLLLLGTLTLGQYEGFFPNQNQILEQIIPRIGAKYPLPEWVSPGLVVLYSVQAGNRTAGEEGQSGYYANGYSILLVTNVANNISYGIWITILSDLEGMTQVNTSSTALPIYINPEQIRDILAQSAELAKQNIIVSGGQNPDGSFLLSYTFQSDLYGASSYNFIVSQEGRILKFIFLEKQPTGTSLAEYTFLKTFHVDWPKLEFPEVAQESHSYTILSSALGYWTPIGKTIVNFNGFQGPLAVYDVSYQLYDVPYSNPNSKLTAIPEVGPFYIHPSLLQKDTILEIPDIAFSWVNEIGEDGTIYSTIYFNGQALYRAICDPRGLALSMQTAIGPMTILQQLEM